MTPTVDNTETTKLRPQWRDPALVAGLALLVYLFTLGFGFVYDDLSQIVGNPQLRSWSYAPSYFTHNLWAFANLEQDNYYRPLLLVWLRICYAIFGLHAWGWHLATALCHVAASVLCLRWLRSLGVHRLAALLAALLFALHPAHLENAVWCSAVNDPLLAVFSFAAFIAHRRWTNDAQNRGRWIAIICCAAALLTKESAILLPVLFCLYELIFSKAKDWRGRLMLMAQRCWTYWLLYAMYIPLRAYAMRHVSSAIWKFPLTTVIYSLPEMGLFYLRQMLSPTHMAGFYSMGSVAEANSSFWAPLLILALVAVALGYAIWKLDDRRRAIFGLLLFVLTLAPTLYFPAYRLGEMVHDRYLYLPLAGAALLLAELSTAVIARWPNARPRMTLAAVIILFSFACMDMVVEQHYCNDLSFYSWSFESAPENIEAGIGYAHALHATGHLPESVTVLEHVLRVYPEQWLALRDLGNYYFELGRFAEAEAILAIAEQHRDDDDAEHYYRGISLLNLQQPKRAAEELQRALQLNPKQPNAHMGIAFARHSMGDAQGAWAEAQAEARLQPQRAKDIQEQLIIWGMAK